MRSTQTRRPRIVRRMVVRSDKLLRRQVASNLRQRRRDLGLSQEAVANEAGFHRTFIGHVERAETNISIDNLERLALALRLPAYELLTPGDGHRHEG